MNQNQEAATIVALERAALDRWGRGDPAGFLELSEPGVVYFDPFVDRRVDGLGALTHLYEAVRGEIQFDRYELLNPAVQICGDAAILTFNFVSWKNEAMARWNCTEVYRKTTSGWRIIQTHWSLTQRGASEIATPA